MGFAGRNAGGRRHAEQLEKAFLNGRVAHKKTNTAVIFEGEAERFTTFEGLHWRATGRMTFEHWDTSVLAVDFDRDMITDFGYTGYSMTTDTNLRGWHRALCGAGFLGMRSLDVETSPFRWTSKPARSHGGRGTARTCSRVSAPASPGPDKWPAMRGSWARSSTLCSKTTTTWCGGRS